MSMNSGTRNDPMFASRPKWGWFVALGVAMIILGFVAWMDVVAVTFASTFVIGLMLVIGGILQIAHGFIAKHWRDFAIGVLLGVLYVIGGLLIVREPVRGAVALTIAVAAIVIVGGVARIVVAVRHRHVRSWGLILFSGIVSLLVGVLIYATLPWSGLWVLGVLIAAELIIQGIGWLTFGLTLRPSAAERSLGTTRSVPPGFGGGV